MPIRSRAPRTLPVALAAVVGCFAVLALATSARAQVGRSCTTDDGREGSCRRVGACRAPNERVPDLCPGGERIQCCVEPAEPTQTGGEGSDESPADTPETASGAEGDAGALEADADEGAEQTDAPVEEAAPPAPRADDEDLSGLPPLRRAEQAYRNIDFVVAGEAAMQAIREGGLGPSELARAYELHGTASAALGDDDAALSSFVRMLALDPDREVRELSPALRAPYLQARGQVATMDELFSVEVTLSRPTSSVSVRLVDPFELAATIIVRSRGGGTGDFQEERFDAAPAVRQTVEGIPETGWAETAVEVLDEYGNRLRVAGTVQEPLTLGEPIIVVEGRAGWKSPWLWTALGLVVLGGAGAGLYYGLRPQPYDAQLGVCFGCF